jgi:hypothetical protein
MCLKSAKAPPALIDHKTPVKRKRQEREACDEEEKADIRPSGPNGLRLGAQANRALFAREPKRRTPEADRFDVLGP